MSITGGAMLTGLTAGEDVMVALVDEHGATLVRSRSTWDLESSFDCRAVTFSAADAGFVNGFPGGSYEMHVDAGPQLRQLTSVPLELA